MKLFLLRHALAKEAISDELRPLNSLGENQVQEICKSISKDLFLGVAQIWHSPYLRAKQTATLFKEKLNLEANCVCVNNTTPCDNPEEVASLIASVCLFGADLMLVGHNPHLEELADILLGGKNRYSKTRFSNCTLACFELEEMPSPANKFGTWSLSLLLSPNVFSKH